MKPSLFRASAAAIRLREQYSIESPDELDLESIARCLGIEVVDGQFSGFDAYLLRSNNAGIIRVRSDVVPGRKRFSIAHELGHWHLHPRLQQLCTSEDMNDYQNSPEETEANTFAAELLLPRFWIPDHLFKEDPSLEAAKWMARNLDVSLTCAIRRFVELSMQPLVLVASSEGRVRSITRSKEAVKRKLWIAPGSAVSRYSHTYQNLNNDSHDSPMAEIDSDVWFDGESRWLPEEVLEEAISLPAFSTTLTLLWVP